MFWEDYKMMKSIDETIDQLERYNGKARIIAGGTDLMVQCREETWNEKVILLDVSSVPEMRQIREEDGWITIGAATTMCQLAESPVLQKHGKALSTGALQLGSPQIRNVATLGGNVVSAQPGADTSIPLIALAAEAKISSRRGEKWVLVEDSFQDIGQSSVDGSRELLTHFRFRPTGNRGNSSLQRLARRRTFTLPSLVVAVALEFDEYRGSLSKVHIAAGPVARTPWRAREAEEILMGSRPSSSLISRAASLAKKKAQPRDSLRAGAEYRKEMIEVLTKRAFEDCLEPFGGMAES